MCFIARESADRAPQRAPDKNDFLRVEERHASLICPGSAGVPPAACFTAPASCFNAKERARRPRSQEVGGVRLIHLGFHGQVDPMQKPFLAADGTSAIDRANDDIGETMRLRLFRTQVELREAEQRAYDLFLQNLVKGTSHLSHGQEAIAAGFANAMKPGDLSF